MEQLALWEIDKLTKCEIVIENGLRTFVDVGTALLEIRDERLYRKDFETFEDYCRGRWNMVRQHANRLIAAAETIGYLEPIGSILPTSEWQTRPLTQLEPEEQRQAWQRVIEKAPATGITAALVLQAAREINREKQAKRRKDQIAETPVIPDDKYNVIYADPPWKYDYGFDIHGAADRHYSTLTPQEIAALPIRDLFEDNAVLFLWTTSPKLEDAFTVIDGWGFEYKTSFIWDKVKHVMGHYNSVRHEFLLICTRGSFPKQSNTLHDSVITIERSEEHSEKPEEFRSLIEDMYPLGKKIELFARRKAEGWDTWGNEL